MKKLKFLSFILAFTALLVVDMAINAGVGSAILGFAFGSTGVVVGAAIGAALIIGGLFAKPGHNVAFDLILYKELFAKKLLEKYRVDGEFMKEVTNDYSAFVDDEGYTINWAELGADPQVFENSTVKPISVAQLSESVKTVNLNELITETTEIGRIDRYLSRIDRVEAAVKRHRGALIDRIIMRAAHNYAPASNTTDTPVLATTGATVSGFKKLAIDDIIELDEKFNLQNFPKNRVLVLHPTHKKHILQEDKDLFKAFANTKTGECVDMYGFKIYVSNAVPLFTTSGSKQAFGSVADGSTSPAASFAFCPDEVMKAMGKTEAFFASADVHYRANLLGFNQFYIAQAMRNKARAAIYSAAA